MVKLTARRLNRYVWQVCAVAVKSLHHSRETVTRMLPLTRSLEDSVKITDHGANLYD